MRPLRMPGFIQVFLAEPFFAVAAFAADITVHGNVGENRWAILDVIVCAVRIGIAVDHKNVLAAAFGANTGVFHGKNLLAIKDKSPAK